MKLRNEPLESEQGIPPNWHISLTVGSIGWIIVCWYRWHFSKEWGLMMADAYEWDLRHFWKIDKTP